MSRIGFVSVLYAVWISSACSTQEIGFERDGQDHTVERDGRDYIEDERQRFEVNPGGTLTVDAELGAIRIRSSNNDEVDVLVRKRLRTTDADEARKTFRNVEIVFNQTDTGVRIEVDQIDNTVSRWFWQDWPDQVSVDIEVLVPVAYNLYLSTISDDIQTGNTVGSVTAKTLSGNISTGPTEGNLNIETTSGNIETSRVEGDVHAESLSGNIVIGPVNGDATVGTTSGNIETDSVDGDLKASSLSGSVKTGPVRNDVAVSTTAGNIETRDILGNVQSGSLSGNISIGAVNGNASASTTSGNIEASNVLGVTETRSLSGDIRLGPTHGGIVASTTSGDIEGESIVTDASVDARYEFQTLSGDISVILPVDLPAVIDAQIGIGSIIDPSLPTWWHVERHIDSDFVLEVHKVESSPGNYRIEAVGEINGGGNDITLVTNDGKIRIRSKNDE